MGLGLRLVKMPSDELFAALNDDKIDIAMNNYAMTSTREKSIDFTSAYACSGVSIVSRVPNFNKNTDLAGKTIGASKGSIMLTYIEKLPFEKTVKVYDTNMALIQAASAGQVDATYAWTSMQSGLKKVLPIPLYWSPELWSSPAGMAVAGGNNSLKQSLNIYLARYLRTNDAVQLMKKYYGKDLRCGN
ncbi:amino acid ABC transporter substrate-binding protein [Deinococcus cavernae]|uniref:Amino acid ABC transporter substrate-binding protein n=1 Tax=Deinococcus cavernae TaxID=2320857 RepID=A0A418V4K1_9DEIO|nr:amino acid ABC transporter substrate-binding protein [Deinococcus cavernae]